MRTLLCSLRPRRRRRSLGAVPSARPRYLAVEPGLLEDPAALRALLEALSTHDDGPAT